MAERKAIGMNADMAFEDFNTTAPCKIGAVIGFNSSKFYPGRTFNRTTDSATYSQVHTISILNRKNMTVNVLTFNEQGQRLSDKKW